MTSSIESFGTRGRSSCGGSCGSGVNPSTIKSTSVVMSSPRESQAPSTIPPKTRDQRPKTEDPERVRISRMRTTAEILKTLDLPARDAYDLPASRKRFGDGG